MGAHAAPPLSRKLNVQLSTMMFLQYAIWGAWLPLFGRFLSEKHGLAGSQIGTLFAVGAIGAIVAPFVAGQIADRWFNTEKFLGLSHILGAILVWQLAHVDTYTEFLWFSLAYSLFYAPTLPLTNSLAFHHLPDRDRDFGRIRAWGTVGWIVVGIGVSQWLSHQHTNAAGELDVGGIADAFRASALIGLALGLYCFTLPKTPPQEGQRKSASLEALSEVVRTPRTNVLFWLFVIAFPIACVHQFYFVHTAGFIDTIGIPQDSMLRKVFGVGGGGLMTIGQVAEIAVLASMPFLAKRYSRKTLLAAGLAAYALRFAIFAFVPHAWAVVPALALHGVCFGCFFFVAFMIVDEETTTDVRASAQGLLNLVLIGFGVIVGSKFAGLIWDTFTTTVKSEVPGEAATKVVDYQALFGIPAGIAAACLVLLLVLYPSRSRSQGPPA